eukprot:jgi/Tetstr1/441074/TSEL_029342.t1
MREELVNITKQIELHSERYSKCHRSPGETVRDFRTLLLTHTRVKNLVTEETTRIVEISRVNVEFIARARGKTRFSPRINFAKQQLVDYTMDTQVDRTWEMAEWLDKSTTAAVAVAAATTVVVEAATERVATTIDVEVKEVIVEAGARRGALTPVIEMMVGEAATSMRQATDGHEPKNPQLNGYAQVVGGGEGKVVGLAAASHLRPQRKSTEAQRHGVNTSVTVPVSLANGGGQPRMPLMEIAKRLVKHEPVEDGWEKHAAMRHCEIQM